MIWLALALAAPAITVPGNTHAKMIVMRGATGIAVTDYASLAQCEAARALLLRMQREYEQSHPAEQMPGGGIITYPGWMLSPVCLPG